MFSLGQMDTNAKDEGFGDLWCEALEFKTYLYCDMPKKLWGNWPMKEEVDITYGCKERNFWYSQAIILGLIKEADEKLLLHYCVLVYNPELAYEH